MSTYRKSAITVGVLFLIALILNLIASEIMNPVLNAPDDLQYIYPNKNKVIIGSLLNLICALAMIFIPVVLYRVVHREYKNIALVYIVFRALEGVLFIYLVIKTLLFISVSKAYINAEATAFPVLQTIGDTVHEEIHWATITYVIIFALGGWTFYYLLYKSKLVPGFFSIWGILSVIILFAGIVMALFGLGIFANVPLMKGMAYFAPSIALNELVLGIWLIVKGFNPPVKK